jgi:hypothetical protein
MAAKEPKERIATGVEENVKAVSAFTRQVKYQPAACVVKNVFFVFFAFSRGRFNCEFSLNTMLPL